MFVHYCNTDTPTLLLHVMVDTLYIISGTRIHQFTRHRYVIYFYHRYIDARHITVTHAYMVSLFWSYGSMFLLHVLLCHVPVFMLHDYFLLLIWVFPLLDMRAVDMRYVDFHIY